MLFAALLLAFDPDFPLALDDTTDIVTSEVGSEIVDDITESCLLSVSLLDSLSGTGTAAQLARSGKISTAGQSSFDRREQLHHQASDRVAR